MSKRRARKPALVDPFERVRTVGLALPDVEATTKYDGSPVLKVGGSFMAGLATHPSAAPQTPAVRGRAEEREWPLAGAPAAHSPADYCQKDAIHLLHPSPNGRPPF